MSLHTLAGTQTGACTLSHPPTALYPQAHCTTYHTCSLYSQVLGARRVALDAIYSAGLQAEGMQAWRASLQQGWKREAAMQRKRVPGEEGELGLLVLMGRLLEESVCDMRYDPGVGSE